eukprot:GHVH01005548.1.p1 GENE.GHVH01005548.1~~GHVH01005548.1.p1  ORF type:complete len:170 (+),score=20.90 GHVH01005548.1:410-919(+)
MVEKIDQIYGQHYPDTSSSVSNTSIQNTNNSVINNITVVVPSSYLGGYHGPPRVISSDKYVIQSGRSVGNRDTMYFDEPVEQTLYEPQLDRLPFGTNNNYPHDDANDNYYHPIDRYRPGNDYPSKADFYANGYHRGSSHWIPAGEILQYDRYPTNDLQYYPDPYYHYHH